MKRTSLYTLDEVKDIESFNNREDCIIQLFEDRREPDFYFIPNRGFIAKLSNVFIKGNIINNIDYFEVGRREDSINVNSNFKNEITEEDKKNAERRKAGYFISYPRDGNYNMFVFTSLIKLLYLDLINYRDIKDVIVSGKEGGQGKEISYIEDHIKMFNLNVIPQNRTYYYETLIIPGSIFSSFTYSITDINPFFSKFYNLCKIYAKEKKDNIVFIARDPSENGDDPKRHLKNIDDIILNLKKINVETYFFSKLSVQEKSEILHNAKGIIVESGASTTNVIFTPKTCKVLFIANPDWDKSKNPSGIKDLNHWYRYFFTKELQREFFEYKKVKSIGNNGFHNPYIIPDVKDFIIFVKNVFNLIL